MPTYVALLRAVNVGGRNRVPMETLRKVMTLSGYANVRTYIQSGNVVFESENRAEETVEKDIARLIQRRFELEIGVVLRTQSELAAVLRGNPFLPRGEDPAVLHVSFLGKRPTRAQIAKLDPRRSPPDEFLCLGREVFLCCPEGLGRTKLTVDYFERFLGAPITTRNWRTVIALEEMARS